MKTKTIIFDIDGVLADFTYGYTKLANQYYGTPIVQGHEQPTWDRLGGLTDDQEDEMWGRIIESKDFWFTLPALVPPETFDRISTLDESFYFVTSRVGRDVKQQTEDWLWEHGITCPTVIVSSRKAEIAAAVKATHTIEDKAGNAVAIQYMSRAKSYLLDRPYNRFPHDTIGTKVIRVHTVEEFLDELEDN